MGLSLVQHLAQLANDVVLVKFVSALDVLMYVFLHVYTQRDVCMPNCICAFLFINMS